MLEALERTSREKYVPAYSIARIWAGLADRDQTLLWLEKAFQEGSPRMVFLDLDPAFDPFRPDTSVSGPPPPRPVAGTHLMPMSAETHRFKVGAFNCLAVSDGTFVYPAEMFFANARKEDYESELRRPPSAGPNHHTLQLSISGYRQAPVAGGYRRREARAEPRADWSTTCAVRESSRKPSTRWS